MAVTTAPQSTLRVVVKAKHHEALLFELIHPTVIPRVGDRVEFSDGLGVVETVTWKPDRSRLRHADMTIVVECVPA